MISGEKLAPEIAADLWPKILQHKWLLSEKLHRDVGLRTTCIDYIHNMEQAHKEFMAYQRKDILAEMGAQTISREVWDTISDSQPPKKLVQQKIILPLTEKGLSTKHGVVPPKTIIFFGPPGTGKTHFVRAIAGIGPGGTLKSHPVCSWRTGWRISEPICGMMEKSRNLDGAVSFIDEFEELAGRRDEGKLL